MRIREPGIFFDPGSRIGNQDGKIRIRDKHPGTATLHKCMKKLIVILSDNFLSSRISWRTEIFVPLRVKTKGKNRTVSPQ
jgi:hypothetical protein